MINLIVKYHDINKKIIYLIALFFLLIGEYSAQERDSAYYKARVKEIIKLKNQLNDSVFIKAEVLKKELKEVGGFEFYIIQTEFAEANYFYRKQEFDEAILRFQKLHDKARLNKDTLTEINAKESIANVYQFLDEHEKVVEYFTEGYNYWRSIGSKKYLARSARNIAESQMHLGNYNEAKEMLDTAINIYKGIKDSNWTAISYYYLAGLYAEKLKVNNNDSLSNIQSLTESIQIGRSFFVNGTEGGFLDGSYKYYESLLAFLSNNYNESIKLGLDAYQIMLLEGFSSKSDLPATTILLANAFEKNNDLKNALKYLEIHQNYMDSTAILSENENARSHSLKVEYKNKRSEEELASKAKIESEKLNHNAYLDRQKMYYLIGGLALIPLLIIVFVIFKRRKKLNWFYAQLFERTNDLNDSINYAERIQRAMLPLNRDLDQHFKEHFILYKPKHIVAGDFYWLEQKNNYIYIAVADCTGHGVPGALVSLVCHEALQRSLYEFDLNHTQEILNKTRDLLKQRFKYSSGETIKDGMDIALCRLDLNNNKVEFSGANNPLWILRNDEMLAYKGNKQPVGEYYAEKPFTCIEEDLKEGDLLYMFSDGYIDQFGGESGKKLKTPNFRKFILKNASKKLSIQGKLLADNFENWRRDIEQIDDVCIIGIKLK